MRPFRESFLREILLSYRSTKVFSLKNFPAIRYVLYLDGTVQYLSKSHIPYAILVIFMLSIFNISPSLFLVSIPVDVFSNAWITFHASCKHYRYLWMFSRVASRQLRTTVDTLLLSTCYFGHLILYHREYFKIHFNSFNVLYYFTDGLFHETLKIFLA